ncbi:MAG TPA: MarR family transcriptional regulator [Dehalococcoidia bacterium]|nr:MarR family transcriptional regulator [Dehalococcoidia bacterium]
MPHDRPEDELALLVADIYEAAGALRRSGDQLAQQAGQTQARWQLMSVASEGNWTVPAIASRLGISRQAVQRVADDLVANGDLRYIENPSHRRSPWMQLTEKGRRSLESITTGSRRWRAQVAGGVSIEDMAQARNTLKALTARIRNTPS